jgi:Domain of unknown function (DUF6458)
MEGIVEPSKRVYPSGPRGNLTRMTVGGSIFLIAVGAILRYAITDSISGIDLQVIGLILMIAGVVGLLIGLFMYANASRRATVVERDRYIDDPRDPRV